MTAVLLTMEAISWPEAILGIAGLGFSGFILWLMLR